MKNLGLSKILFYATLVSVVLGLAFGYGLYSGMQKNQLYVFAKRAKAHVKTVFQEAPTLAKIHPKHFLQPSRYEGSSVTINKYDGHEDEFVLLSGFFEDKNELRLIRRNGEIIARWPVVFSKIFPDASHMHEQPTTDWNIDTHGALILSDGSVVFNFEYGGLVKIDRCGKILWTLAKPTHHSVEMAEDGGFWVPGRRIYSRGVTSPFPPFTPPFNEDTILKVSDKGAVIFEISVPKLFFDNGLEAILTASGEEIGHNRRWDHEIVHLNKIAVLKTDLAADFPLFEAGDLLLSLRQCNMLMVIDPATETVKWWHIGPWLRQHDPEFIPGGKFLIFNNNSYIASYGTESQSVSNLDIPRISNIIEYNPVTLEHKVIYGENKDQELLSVIRGKLEYTSRGGLLITEFEGGRVLETDADGQIIWEYINRYSLAEVAEITESRIYPKSYFTVSDWSCEHGVN
jgi:hypothetical protein